MQDLYEVLEVSPAASAEEISAALTAQRRIWMHRQTAPTIERRQQAELRLAALAEAERVLLEPARRAAYDSGRMGGSSSSTSAPAPVRPPPTAPTAPTATAAPAPTAADSGLDWPKTARILNVVIVVGLLIGALSLLAHRNDTSTYASGDGYDSGLDEGYETSGDGGVGYDDTGGTTSTTSLDPYETTSTEGTSPSGCIDGQSSAYWPPTTEGPVIDCPDYPFGRPARSLADGHPQWIVVLESINLPEVARVDSRMAELEVAAGGTLGLYDSRVFAGLRDPYWVIFAGPFSTRDEANAFCSSNSHLDPCYPRAP